MAATYIPIFFHFHLFSTYKGHKLSFLSSFLCHYLLTPFLFSLLKVVIPSLRPIAILLLLLLLPLLLLLLSSSFLFSSSYFSPFAISKEGKGFYFSVKYRKFYVYICRWRISLINKLVFVQPIHFKQLLKKTFIVHTRKSEIKTRLGSQRKCEEGSGKPFPRKQSILG